MNWKMPKPRPAILRIFISLIFGSPLSVYGRPPCDREMESYKKIAKDCELLANASYITTIAGMIVGGPIGTAITVPFPLMADHNCTIKEKHEKALDHCLSSAKNGLDQEFFGAKESLQSEFDNYQKQMRDLTSLNQYEFSLVQVIDEDLLRADDKILIHNKTFLSKDLSLPSQNSPDFENHPLESRNP